MGKEFLMQSITSEINMPEEKKEPEENPTLITEEAEDSSMDFRNKPSPPHEDEILEADLETLSVEELTKKKIIKEIVKLHAEKTKTDEELKELKRPPYFRAGFIFVLVPALLSLLAATATIYVAYLSPQLDKIEKANKELASRQTEIENLNTEREKAEKQLGDLKREVIAFKATSEAERKEKERIENINRNLESEQTVLNNSLNTLKTLKEKDQTVIDSLQRQYAKLNVDIAEARKAVSIAKIEIPLIHLLEDSIDADTLVASGAEEIATIYNSNPQSQDNYDEHFKELLGKKYTLRQKLRIAVLMYSVAKDIKWKNRAYFRISEAVRKALSILATNKSDAQNKLVEIAADIDALKRQYGLFLDVLDDEIQTVSDSDMAALYFALNRSGSNFKRGLRFYGATLDHPIFFRFLRAGVDLTNENDEKSITDGLDLIGNIGGSYVFNIFLKNLLDEGKISRELINRLLKREIRNWRGSEPYPFAKDSTDLETKFKSTQMQCLNRYWSEANWTKLRSNKELFIKIMQGECN